VDHVRLTKKDRDNMKKTLLATTALAFIAVSASAVDVELYGQVNKGVFAVNDGENTDFVVVDNAKDSTRMGLKGAQALDNGLTASVLFEGEMVSNASDAFTQSTTVGAASTPAGTGTGTFTQRQARVGLSGNFGGVYVGRQSTAFEDVIAQDLVGVQDLMDIDNGNFGGGMKFRNSATNAFTTTTVNSLAGTASTNKADSVRYDSPIFAGLQGRLSAAQGGDLEGSVFYAADMGDFKAVAAGGVRFDNDTNTVTANRSDVVYGASASLAHSSGIAGTLGYTTTTLEKGAAPAPTTALSSLDDPSKMYVKVGYAWDAFEVAGDYAVASDYRLTGAKDDELTSMGLGAQYNIGNGVSVAGLYRNHDAEITGTNTESVDMYGVNMRVKF
jgi:hypothetical protein